MSGLSRVNERSWKYVLVAAVIGFIVFGWGITRVGIETNQAEWFPKNGEFYESLMVVDKNLSGLGDMEILIKGKEGTGETVVTTSTKAIKTYRDKDPTGAGGLSAVSTGGGQ